MAKKDTDGIILLVAVVAAFVIFGGGAGGGFGGFTFGGGGGGGNGLPGNGYARRPSAMQIAMSAGPEIFAGVPTAEAINLVGGATYQDRPEGWSGLDWEDFLAGN